MIKSKGLVCVGCGKPLTGGAWCMDCAIEDVSAPDPVPPALPDPKAGDTVGPHYGSACACGSRVFSKHEDALGRRSMICRRCGKVLGK